MRLSLRRFSTIVGNRVTTLAGLTASQATPIVHLTGIDPASRRGGGLFAYLPSREEREDGGTVFNAADGFGQYLRMTDGNWLNAQWFGAVGDRTQRLLSSLYATRAEVEARWPLIAQSGFSATLSYFGSTYGFTWATDWGDATLDWIGIQSAILRTRGSTTYLDSGRTGAGVVIPAGTYYISLPIVSRSGNRITGHSPATESDNWSGTTIRLVSGSNVPGFITYGEVDGTEYWHYGELSNMLFIGDRNNSTGAQVSTAGSGVVLNRMGEMAWVDRVRSQLWAEHGMTVTNIPTPGHLGKVSFFRNYDAGLFVSMSTGGQLHVQHLSGDNNRNSLLKCGSNYKSTVSVETIKSERSDISGAALTGNTDICHLATTNGLTLNIGTMSIEATGAAPGNSFFKITGATGYITVHGNIVCRDGSETGYSHGIDNTFTTTTKTVAAINNIGPWSTRTAAWSII